MYKDDLSYGLFLSDRQLDFLFNYPQGFDRMKCFATFLQMSVKEPTHYEKKEYSVDLTPGQFAISEVELAQLWKCNRKTASKMVDMFHEVGLVSSVPNFRTTVFTVHCIASWYVGGQEIRNTHYSRNPQVEPRIKANHKSQSAATCNVGNGTATDGAIANGVVANRTVADVNNGNYADESNSLSLSSTDSDLEQTAHQSDGQTIEQRDEYTFKHSDPVSHDNSNDGNDRERKPFNDGVEPTTPNEENLFSLALNNTSPSITLTDAAYLYDRAGNEPENEAQPSSEPPGDTPPDATAIVAAETTPDDAG
ncbi:MAG: hypothetical protein J6I37_10035 [Prevotella sp.]|nr:hypothetical protein [Bacteroidales bacterium]MBP3777311.1 hypothetical protein [Prevotella sp.]